MVDSPISRRTRFLTPLALRSAVVALVAFTLPGAALALPQRTLVARPLPPGVLAASDAGSRTVLTTAAAQSLTDSLLGVVSTLRGLKPIRPVPVQALDRGAVRARLEEITRRDGIEPSLRQEERIFKFLGLAPADVDFVKLYHDLLEEQLAGFYDIDRRE